MPDEIDRMIHPELAGDDGEPDDPDHSAPGPLAAEPAPLQPPPPAARVEPEAPAEPVAPTLPQPVQDTGFYYRNGAPIPPTHPDHGPMHLIPRQEDGSFAAYYYCSKAELAAAGIPSPPPRRHRRDGFSAERQARFVEHYRDTGSLTDAARLTGISRSTAYNLINSPDGAAFRAAIEEAGRGIDTILEATAFERCINGQEEIVYHKGERVGVRWKYDNKLLMQMLRARNPLKYAPLSEIEGWLKRRGAEPPADLDGTLDRLAAAEAEWGRRLPGEEPPPAAAIEAPPERLQARVIASISSGSSGEAAQESAAIASNSSTLPAEPPARSEAGAQARREQREESASARAAGRAANPTDGPQAAPTGPDTGAIASNSSTLPGPAHPEQPPGGERH